MHILIYVCTYYIFLELITHQSSRTIKSSKPSQPSTFLSLQMATTAESVVQSLKARAAGSAVEVWVNGRLFTVPDPSPETTLLEFLRANGLTGTKLGCGEVSKGNSKVANKRGRKAWKMSVSAQHQRRGLWLASDVPPVALATRRCVDSPAVSFLRRLRRCTLACRRLPRRLAHFPLLGLATSPLGAGARNTPTTRPMAHLIPPRRARNDTHKGGCGACTVMMSQQISADGKPVHVPLNACLAPLCAMDRCHITTTEGIGGIRQVRSHSLKGG